MLEKLAGRLSWEPTGGGIRVSIPAPRSWALILLAAWLIAWTIGGRQAFHELFKSATSQSVNWFGLLWLIVWAVGECAVVFGIIWGLGGSTTLTLDYSTLNITRQLFGLRLNGFTCATNNVRNLRYAPAGHGKRSTLSFIKFEMNDKTCSFAEGISDVEAFALIDKMLEVYKFPKDRALEYIDTSN